MSKRKYANSFIKSNIKSLPHVNSINDLIEIGKSTQIYKNLDIIMLRRITPYMEKLNNMIGMKSLKDSVLYQIIYYLKGFHLKNTSNEYLHTMIMGPPGHGKCMGKDTPIIMYDGTIKMVQNLKYGDKIMGDDSTPRNILSTCTGKETMYKIKQEYGDSYIVNESHILSLKLSKNPRIKHITLKNNFQVIWFTKKSKKSKTFAYSIKSIIRLNKYEYMDMDMDTVYKKAVEFAKTLPSNGEVIDINVLDYFKRSKSWKDAYKGFKVSVKFPETDIELDPYILGVCLGDNCEKKEYNIHIPLEYKVTSESNRLMLIAGLLDSKGSKHNDCYEITQKNKKLADDILFLTRSLGFRSTIKELDESYTYKIIFSGDISKIPTQITGKKCPSANIKDVLVYGINIEKLKIDDYYGFEIDGNHRFLLGDFTVTHNTEVASIIAKIYQSIGILSPDGPFKVAHRDDFVAGYLGQTAIKTRQLLESCIGGVLFVDEVYSLGPEKSNSDNFAKECIETITGFLSEHKNDFCFIGAGYEENIKNCFFAGNKGLERRFQWNHVIDKYSENDLTDIMIKMIKEINWDFSIDRDEIVKFMFQNMKLFKNAGGDIETFLSKCKIFHAKRVFSLDEKHMFILTKTDLEGGLSLIKKYKLKEEENENTKYMSMYI